MAGALTTSTDASTSPVSTYHHSSMQRSLNTSTRRKKTVLKAVKISFPCLPLWLGTFLQVSKVHQLSTLHSVHRAEALAWRPPVWPLSSSGGWPIKFSTRFAISVSPQGRLKSLRHPLRFPNSFLYRLGWVSWRGQMISFWDSLGGNTAGRGVVVSSL